MSEGCVEFFSGGWAEWSEGEADFWGRDDAFFGEGVFDGDGVSLDEEVAEEGVEALVELGGASGVACVPGVDHFEEFCGDEVGGDANDAAGAGCEEGKGEGVVAGEDLEGWG